MNVSASVISGYIYNIYYRGFWDWMYPVNGGEETVSDAALGVVILWFSW